MVSHFFLLLIYAGIVSVFFAALWRRERKDQLKLFLQMFLGMVLGALVVAYLMYPFPDGPPPPVP